MSAILDRLARYSLSVNPCNDIEFYTYNNMFISETPKQQAYNDMVWLVWREVIIQVEIFLS